MSAIYVPFNIFLNFARVLLMFLIPPILCSRLYIFSNSAVSVLFALIADVARSTIFQTNSFVMTITSKKRSAAAAPSRRFGPLKLRKSYTRARFCFEHPDFGTWKDRNSNGVQ